jgi:hypothetical protein
MTKLLPLIAIAVMGLILYKQNKEIKTIKKAFIKTADRVDELVQAYNDEAYRNMIIDNNLYSGLFEEYEVYEEAE